MSLAKALVGEQKRQYVEKLEKKITKIIQNKLFRIKRITVQIHRDGEIEL